VFSTHSSFGSIPLLAFSLIWVTDNNPHCSQYCAGLYYQGSKKTFWKVHLVVTKNLEACITVRTFIMHSIHLCTNNLCTLQFKLSVSVYMSTKQWKKKQHGLLFLLQDVNCSLRDATVGPDLEFEFESDYISVDIPSDGAMRESWSIVPLTPPVVRIIKLLVDYVTLTNLLCYLVLVQ